MRYMVCHKLPLDVTQERIHEVQQLAQKDPQIKGYRSFINLTEGTAVCIFDSPGEKTLTDWLRRNDLPYESITVVELEGEYGKTTDLRTPVGTGTGSGGVKG